MKVKDLMTTAPYYCQPETNLGSATELMWNANCGFLPVVGNDGKVVGVVTDRDICIALGTRNHLPGDVTVGEVIAAQRLYYCCPDDDVRVALQAMQTGGVRRLPVITHDGLLAGIVSMDDVLLRAELTSLGGGLELSSDEIVRAFRSIAQQQAMVKQAAAWARYRRFALKNCKQSLDRGGEDGRKRREAKLHGIKPGKGDSSYNSSKPLSLGCHRRCDPRRSG